MGASQDWRPVSQQIAEMNDPYTLRRLDRLRELGAETHQILRLEVPQRLRQLYTDQDRPQKRGSVRSFRSLISSAATVEGDSRSLERRVDKLSQKIRPQSFAKQIRNSATEVARHAEHLHDELADSDPSEDRLREEVEKVAENWKSLGASIDQLSASRSNTEVDRTLKSIVFAEKNKSLILRSPD